MPHEILKDFKGSQDGRFTERFIQGTTRELSAALAEIAVKEGWAREVVSAAPPQPTTASSRKPRASSAAA